MYEEKYREAAYRFYIADSLYASMHNACIDKKFSELLDILKNPEKEEQASGDEIVNDIMSRHGLRFEQ